MLPQFHFQFSALRRGYKSCVVNLKASTGTRNVGTQKEMLKGGNTLCYYIVPEPCCGHFLLPPGVGIEPIYCSSSTHSGSSLFPNSEIDVKPSVKIMWLLHNITLHSPSLTGAHTWAMGSLAHISFVILFIVYTSAAVKNELDRGNNMQASPLESIFADLYIFIMFWSVYSVLYISKSTWLFDNWFPSHPS